MKTILVLVSMGALLLGLEGSALAGPVRGSQAAPAAQPARPAEAARTQRLTFGDDVVTAGRDLGGGDVLSVTRKPKHLSLVRARDNFIPELIKSAEDI